MKILKAIITMTLVVIYAGCGIIVPNKYNEGDLYEVNVNMNKKGLIDIYGAPHSTTTEYLNIKSDDDNKCLNRTCYEIWEYDLYPKGSSLTNFAVGFISFTFSWWVPDMWHYKDRYYFLFYQDKLYGWNNYKEELMKTFSECNNLPLSEQ